MARYVDMPNFQSNDRFEFSENQTDFFSDKEFKDGDEFMEAILENINSTPIGRVLKRIGSLPEIRKGKVLNLRRQITEGRYDITGRLDTAMDRVLEDLTS